MAAKSEASRDGMDEDKRSSNQQKITWTNGRRRSMADHACVSQRDQDIARLICGNWTIALLGR
jgi:hypothetical protein